MKHETCALWLLAAGLLPLTSCADLVVQVVSHSPECPTTRTEIAFTATVANAGTATAGANTLAFRVGGETVPQMYDVPRLGPGESFTVSRNEVLGVAQNYLNTVTVDVNGVVHESNEGNNQATDSFAVSQAPDTTGLSVFVYNELLSTILRGVLIDETAARSLGVHPGYYHLRVFRVWTQTSERAIALCIEKNYAEYLDESQSIFPKRDEPWVFSIFLRDEYSSTTRAQTVQDFYGHKFGYEAEFDSVASCWKVTSASLDCAKVRLSTETLSGTLSTCGWDTEPPWTTP